MKRDLLKGKYALVTGASGGLGADFSRQLAAKGCNLVLVARNEEKLAVVKNEVEKQYGIKAIIISTDLSIPGAAQKVFDETLRQNLTIDVLINNAGFGIYGYFNDIDLEKETNMLQLDIVTLVAMTKLFLKGMMERDFGYILQVASAAGFQPTPLYATYSAAKSFVLDFGEALNFELKKQKSKVGCTVLSPGITATNFLKESGQKKTLYQKIFMMESPRVVKIGLNNLFKKRSGVVSGFMNGFMAWSTRLVSRPMQARVSYMFMKSN